MATWQPCIGYHHLLPPFNASPPSGMLGDTCPSFTHTDVFMYYVYAHRLYTHPHCSKRERERERERTKRERRDPRLVSSFPNCFFLHNTCTHITYIYTPHPAYTELHTLTHAAKQSLSSPCHGRQPWELQISLIFGPSQKPSKP